MPRFHFHVARDQEHSDLSGSELAGLDEARIEAVRFAGELMQQEPARFWKAKDWTMRVTDSRDLTLFSLSLIATESASTQGK